MLIKRETFPDGIYEAPPAQIFVQFAMLRCRACDQMSDWSEQPVDHELAELTFQWQVDHAALTKHKNYYILRVERNEMKIVS